MPLHKVKPRVRFPGTTKKVKEGGGRKAQRNPRRTVFGIAPSFMLAENIVDDEPLFAKTRVPSTDELGSMLRSNLSYSLAATKASEAQHNLGILPPSPTGQHVERLQEENDYPPVSLLRLTPLYRGLNERHFATNTCITGSGNYFQHNGPSASLLATTAIYRPVNDDVEPVSPYDIVIKRAIDDKDRPALHVTEEKGLVSKDDELKPTEAYAEVNEDEDNDPPASLLVTASILIASTHHLESVTWTSQIDVNATGVCAVECEDRSPGPLPPETPDSFEHIKPVNHSSTAPLQPQKHRSTLLQRLVTLFAGRRRYQAIQEELRSTPTSTQEPHGEIALPQLPSEKDQAPAYTKFSDPTRLQPPSRRAAVCLGGTTPPKPISQKNLPLSPPILAPRRPYRPIDERLTAPFIKPAKEHKYTGTHFVILDIFKPAEVQLDFPSATLPTSLTSPVRRQNSEAELLDRNETVWAKWYAKNPTAEHLPFAKANSNQERWDDRVDEVTDHQVWIAHAARRAKSRKTQLPLLSDVDLLRHMEDAEHERAARLRYHPEYCFGALMGDVYPFNGGLII